MERTNDIMLKLLTVLASTPKGCLALALKDMVDRLLEPKTSESEFEEAVRQAETEKLILRVTTRFLGTRWSITDHGRAEYRQSRE